MNPFDLTGKVAIVTGALGLLGRRHCEVLSAAGACVVVSDLDAAACEDFAGSLRARGRRSLGVAADVTRQSDVAAMRDRVLHEVGSIDVLVNNAAINDMVEAPTAALESSRFENYPVALFQRFMEVGVTGTFLCSQILGGWMATEKRGSIINVASTYALVGPNQSLYRDAQGAQRFYKSAAYPTAKGAVLSFTRFLAAYWGHAGVRVNALSPGGVENGQDPTFVATYSERTPLGRMAAPDDFGGALVFLASDASAYMTGTNLVVDGGFTAW